jgi:lipopolysaccharide/colanic/teichoic acid biosynthesis glycosyltransferase
MASRWQAGLKNMSFALDVAILLKTIRVVLLGKGK